MESSKQSKMKPGDVLRILATHPDVLRKRSRYFFFCGNALKDKKRKILVTQDGWMILRKSLNIWGKHPVDMGGSWSDRNEVLEDIHFGVAREIL